MIRIGIIGTGGMAHQRAQAFHAREDTTVVGVCSRSMEKTEPIRELTGAQGYDDVDALLVNVDAVVVCTPNATHASFTLRALERGAHTLVEYPICVSQEETTALRDAAEGAGVVLMTGNTIIHEAMFRFVAAHIDRLGRLISAASRVAFYAGDMGDAWYMQPSLTGPVFASFHYHHIEYYRRLLGEVEWMVARDESVPDSGSSDRTSTAGGTLTMAHASGATSCIQWYLSASGAGLPRGMWINGDKGSVAVLSHNGNDEQSLVMWDEGGPDKTETFENEWGVSGSCEDFARAITGDLDHRERLASDLVTLRVGLAAAESSRTRSLVQIQAISSQEDMG